MSWTREDSQKRVKKGIRQSDSLSSLLFVLCIDPLSRRLNERYPKVSIHAKEISHATNHLLFIDDLKLLATNSTVMGNMVKETESFFKTIGLEINREKSA
ncbi:Retrovirus-related Pol polyprotein from type-2 retrotransposable element R2DM, partial [Astathelohania contejeani]